MARVQRYNNVCCPSWNIEYQTIRMTQPALILPTYTGFIGSTYDAAVLLEACIQGRLLRLIHRPATVCRGQIARSGHVFIFEEKESGVRRWTDDLTWSPSRKLDGFLLYRQVDERGPTLKQPRQVLQSNQRKPDLVAKTWPTPLRLPHRFIPISRRRIDEEDDQHEARRSLLATCLVLLGGGCLEFSIVTPIRGPQTARGSSSRRSLRKTPLLGVGDKEYHHTPFW